MQRVDHRHAWRYGPAYAGITRGVWQGLLGTPRDSWGLLGTPRLTHCLLGDSGPWDEAGQWWGVVGDGHLPRHGWRGLQWHLGLLPGRWSRVSRANPNGANDGAKKQFGALVLKDGYIGRSSSCRRHILFKIGQKSRYSWRSFIIYTLITGVSFLIQPQ